jgi:predicted nucleic acid-binding protein
VKVLVDANVLVSVLNKEYPVYTYSARVLSLADKQNFDLYATPTSLAISFYFSSKKSGEALAKKKLHQLCEHVHIAMISETAVKLALGNKSVHDFEDGMQYYAAVETGCQCIVTEDKDDFYYSDLEVLSCEEFLERHVFSI